MSRRHLLVSILVAALCCVILILFTDIERSVGRWRPGDRPGEGQALPTGR